MGLHSFAADMKSKQFNSRLAAGFCIDVARNGLAHSAFLIPLYFPSFAQLCAVT
jgi:hypothetical protein